MTGKKVLVIALMSVLASSVLVGAISLYNRSNSANNNEKVVTKQQLNSQLNNVVDVCLKSLPNGIKDCDTRLDGITKQLCDATNHELDACSNGKVGQYYKAREQVTSPKALNYTK